MPKTLADHQIQGIGGAGVGLCAQWVLGHDLCDGNILRPESSTHNPESQILCGEDTTQAFIIIDNKDTVSPLRSAKLAGLGYSDALGNGKSRAGLQRSDGALLDIGLAATLAASLALQQKQPVI